MRQYWDRLADRVDAMSLRERVLVFLMVAAVVLALMNVLLLNPLLAKQTRLSGQMKQDEGRLEAVHAQVQALVRESTGGADAARKERLLILKQQIAQVDDALRALQKGLVPPDRMASLLKDILQREGRLQLVSLKTLPASSILEDAQKGAPAEKIKASASSAEGPLVYRHGVEVVVRGEYRELLDYLVRLEGLKWQMFWGKAELKVEEYPRSTLTLTLYTLSLDKTWLAI